MQSTQRIHGTYIRSCAAVALFLAANPSYAQPRPLENAKESEESQEDQDEEDTRTALEAVGQKAWGQSTCRETKRTLSSISTRMRWSVLLPNIRLGVSQGIGATFNYASVDDTLGRSNLWMEARGSWDLDKLLYRSDEWRVLHEEREIERCRQKLVDDTREIFVRWLKLVRAGDRSEDSLLHEATLNERTGGWFRRAIKYGHGRLSIHHERGSL